MRKAQGIFIVVLLFALGYSFDSKAQGIITSNMGAPIMSKAYAEVNGSPYLIGNWSSGSVALKNGQVYKGVPIKYDQVADQLLFKTDGGDSLTFALPVHEFDLPFNDKGKVTERNYRNGFPAVSGNTTDNFYEVINDGKTKLLKRTKKMIQSHKEYSSANVINDIYTNITYYILKNGEMKPVKPGNKTIAEALSDKTVDIEKYVKDNKLDLKKDEDLNKLFEYYNSL